MKALRALAVLLLLAGTALSGRAIYMRSKAELAGILIRHAWQMSIETGVPQRPWPWADTQPVARLKIEKLGYDEIVLEGATPRTLAFGPAHLLSGAGLGEPGNVIIAGHRTSWFKPLEKIAPGDMISIEWLGSKNHLESRNYSVEFVRVVQPKDVSLLLPSYEDRLTMITCYPFGVSPSSPERFVVRAVPVTSDVATAGASAGRD